jgi:hypothetical protein
LYVPRLLLLTPEAAVAARAWISCMRQWVAGRRDCYRFLSTLRKS